MADIIKSMSHDPELAKDFVDYFWHGSYTHAPEESREPHSAAGIWSLEKYVKAGYVRLLGPFPPWVVRARYRKEYERIGNFKNDPQLYVSEFTQAGCDLIRANVALTKI